MAPFEHEEDDKDENGYYEDIKVDPIEYFFQSAFKHGIQLMKTETNKLNNRCKPIKESDESHDGFIQVKKKNKNRRTKKADEPNVVNVKITIYSNGFTVDDDSLRPIDLSDKSFLGNVADGITPNELKKRHIHKSIRCYLLDKRSEKCTIFTGKGMKTGYTTRVVVKENKSQPMTVDQTKEITKIQVKLSNGSRSVIDANLTHTVGDIYAHVKHLNTALTNHFTLIIGYPSRKLTDMNRTIEDEKLQNSVIVQR